MSVLDLTKCPICHAPGSLVRQTTQLETRAHVTYECLECGTLLAWLGDEMWLEADRWSFQQVGRPERADLLYRSMTVAELRKLAGDQPPAGMPAPIGKGSKPKAPPVWIDLKPEEKQAPPVKPEPPARTVEPPPVGRAPETPPEETLPVAPPQAKELEPELPRKPVAERPVPIAAEPEAPAEEPAMAEPEPPEPVAETPTIIAEAPAEGPATVEPGRVIAEPEPREPVAEEPAIIARPPAKKATAAEPEPPELAAEEPAIVAEPPAEGPATVGPGRVMAEPEPPEPVAEKPAIIAEPPAEERIMAEPEPRKPVAEKPAIIAEPPAEERIMAEPEPPEPVAEEPAIVAEPAAEGPATAEPGRVIAEPEPPEPVAGEPAIVAEPPVEEPVPPPVQAVEREAVREPAAGPPPAERKQQPTSRRRRSRGSPFLVISVGFVLLFLICSAAVMIIYSTISNWPGVGRLPTNPPAGEVAATETATPTQTPVPTDTPAPTDTPVPTDTPAPTPSPIPAEPAAVEFQGVTDYVSASGSHYLVGEVLNETADSLRFVEVLATLYDDAGQVVGTGSTFTELSIIEPGSSAPFKLTTIDPPVVGNYELRVDYATTTQSPVRLELLGHTGAADGSGWYRVTGEVRNPHDYAVKFPEIVATFYNATHDVVRVEGVFAEAALLEPGQVSSFEVVVTEPPADLHHYALQTEAVQQ